MRAELHAFSNCDAADMTARVTPRFPRYRALPQGERVEPSPPSTHARWPVCGHPARGDSEASCGAVNGYTSRVAVAAARVAPLAEARVCVCLRDVACSSRGSTSQPSRCFS